MEASSCAAGATCAASAHSAYSYAALVRAFWSLWTAVTAQLSNDFIGGSFALAAASTLASAAVASLRALRAFAHDRAFATFEIPSGTPQYHAAMRWLLDHPAVMRAARRLVVDPRAALDSCISTTAGASDPDDDESLRGGASDDESDPLELGLRTVPMLPRDRTSVRARVGCALVWARHGPAANLDAAALDVAAAFAAAAPASASRSRARASPSSLGAMGGGGARGSWYASLLSGARGDRSLANAGFGGGLFRDSSGGDSSFGDDAFDASSSAFDASSSAFPSTLGASVASRRDAGLGDGRGAIRLRVLAPTRGAAARAVREVLAAGHALRPRGPGARRVTRRRTQVYVPSSATTLGGGGGGGFGGFVDGFGSGSLAGWGGVDRGGGASLEGRDGGSPSASGGSDPSVGAGGSRLAVGYPRAITWVDAGRKPARPVDSVILREPARRRSAGDAGSEDAPEEPPSTATTTPSGPSGSASAPASAAEIVADARAFTRLERWYAERGIPWRRGYLLHGAPGSGKTSLVRAVAGALRYPIYQLSLCGAGLDDDAFRGLLASAANRAILLIEDVDYAAGAAVVSGAGPPPGARSGGGLTLPGLLNALDGVGAADGRLLFMTCRDADALAPALVRPGRIDRRLAFEPPDFSQAARLFLRFYAGHLDRAPSTSAEEEAAEEERAEEGAGEEAAKGGENVTGRGRRKTRMVVSALGGAPSRLERSAAEALSARFARHATGPGSDPRVSMAALQGHLMMHREDPEGAVEAAASAFRARKANGER